MGMALRLWVLLLCGLFGRYIPPSAGEVSSPHTARVWGGISRMNDAPSVNGQTGAAASPALCPAPGTRAQHRKPPVKRCRRRHQPPRRPTRNPTHAEPPRCALSHQLIELGNARYFGVTELCTRT